MIMSGVDDGTRLSYHLEEGAGRFEDGVWKISIGRKTDNDIALISDSYSSRYHALLCWQDETWWLEDDKSRNGTFLEGATLDIEDPRIEARIPIAPGVLFRIGRTWLRIQPEEDE